MHQAPRLKPAGIVSLRDCFLKAEENLRLSHGSQRWQSCAQHDGRPRRYSSFEYGGSVDPQTEQTSARVCVHLQSRRRRHYAGEFEVRASAVSVCHGHGRGLQNGLKASQVLGDTLPEHEAETRQVPMFWVEME
jgi:hypothetical protein